MGRVLFGRGSELAAVSTFLDAVPAGPVALILGGDAGIGKTALWLEALSAARSRSYRVLSCRPTESEAKLSFAALGDLLEGVDDEVLESLPAPQRSALAIALLRAESIGSPPDRRAISAAFRGTLSALAADGPILVAIDDADRLDAPSSRALEFAVRRLDDVPVGFILTTRSGEPGSPPLGLGRFLADQRSRVMDVGPLSLPAIREMLGQEFPTHVPRAVLVRIQEASGGNPFLASELARALLRRGTELEPGMAFPVPSNLADLVRDRLSEMSEPIRYVLLVISAASQATVTLVADAIAEGNPKDDIESALEAGLIEMDGGWIRPTHPLLATVLYAESSGRLRREVHRRLAAVVVDPEERAHHLALATEGPDEGVAAELEDAARRAGRRGAPDAAAELSELALELTPSEPDPRRLRRVVLVGQYAFEAADMTKAETSLEEAVRTAPPGPERAQALLFLSKVRYHSQDAHSALMLAEQALGESGSDPALQAQIRLELTAAAEITGDRAAAGVHAKAAVLRAEDAGDTAALAEALAMVGLLGFLAGEGVQADVLSRAVALESEATDLRPLRSPTFREACILLWSDQLDPARSSFLDLEKRCREGGDEGSLSVILFLLAQLECFAGNLVEAGAHVDESVTISGWTGQQPYRAFALSARALIEGRCGREEGARAAAEEGLALARESGFVQARQLNLWALGFLEVSLGNMKEADRILWPLAESALEGGPKEPGLLRFLPDEVEALVALGENERARSLLEPTIARARTLDRAWALATGERGGALLAAAQGDLSGALAGFDRALDLHERLLVEPFEHARTLYAQGQVLRRSKKWRPARDALGHALEIFERLGAALWVDKARAEMGRIGGRAPGPVGLTPTEQLVAERVSDGLTNREVAAELFLSVSTVEANLRRIYQKLGVRSRTELSRRLPER